MQISLSHVMRRLRQTIPQSFDDQVNRKIANIGCPAHFSSGFDPRKLLPRRVGDLNSLHLPVGLLFMPSLLGYADTHDLCVENPLASEKQKNYKRKGKILYLFLWVINFTWKSNGRYWSDGCPFAFFSTIEGGKNGSLFCVGKEQGSRGIFNTCLILILFFTSFLCGPHLKV